MRIEFGRAPDKKSGSGSPLYLFFSNHDWGSRSQSATKRKGYRSRPSRGCHLV